jgi:hypothetical protein
MRRANKRLAATVLTGFAAVLAVQSAPAAVWRWACQGELGDQRVLFDREGLYIVGGKASAGRPGQVTAQSIEEAIDAVKKGGGFTAFSPEDENGGLASPITFLLTDAGKQTQKTVFTERSSKQISHKHKLICGRDEDTDLYLKVYRYERGGEPARDITVMCMEYQLSTRGGRKGCG